MSLFRRPQRADVPAFAAAPARRPASATAPGGAPHDDWRAYGPIAEDYARVVAARMTGIAADLVDLVAVPPGGLVLDVGTGTGATARTAARAAGARVVGVDPSVGMLRQALRGDGAVNGHASAAAAAAAPGPRFVAAAAIDLPFRDATFGYVTAAFVLNHFARYDTALYDMVRVLASGGRLGVATWGKRDDELGAAWREVAEEFAEREVLELAHREAQPWAERFADPGEVHLALREAGLGEIRVERREYHLTFTREDYLRSREIGATGRFLRQMLGEELWPSFAARARQVFEQRFPEAFNDFRDVNLAIAAKP